MKQARRASIAIVGVLSFSPGSQEASASPEPPLAAPVLPGDGRWHCEGDVASAPAGAAGSVTPGILHIDGATCASLDSSKWSCGLERTATRLTIEQRFDPKEAFVPWPRRWTLAIGPRRMTGTLRVEPRSEGPPKGSVVLAAKPAEFAASCLRVAPIDGVDHLEELYAAKAYTYLANPALALAQRGDPAAQRLVGRMFRNGHGVARDPAKAKLWLEKAVAQRDVGATADLVDLLDRELAPDPARLLALRKQLVETSGSPPGVRARAAIAVAAHLLAADSSNHADARRWMKRAVDAGDPATLDEAVTRYAELLVDGVGGSKDVKTAEALLRKHAADQPLAAARLGDLIAAKVVAGTPEESVAWYRRSFARGSDLGRFLLAEALLSGTGVKKDVAAGLALLEAPEAGAWSKFALGVLLWDGALLAKDQKRALSLITGAATAGHSWAMFWLGGANEGGAFKDSDPVRAQLYYELAAIDKPGRPGGWLWLPAVAARDRHASALTAEQLARAKRSANAARVGLLGAP